MIARNHFLQGIYSFEGAGLDKPAPLSAELSHVVPDGVISQALYFRGGNSTDELITVVLMRDGVPMRYFPIGAKSDVHVPLRVVEDIEGGSVIELRPGRADRAQRHRRRRPRPGGALMTCARAGPAAGPDPWSEKSRLVVIGNGMAGARTVEEILARGGADLFAITMFGDEPYGNYNRIMLSHVLSGEEQRGRHLPEHDGLVRRERHHPARRRADRRGSTGSPRWCSATTARSPRTTS